MQETYAAMAIGEVLGDYLAYREAANPATGNSHLHANGFDKLSLYRSTNGFRIRLHIWWEDAPGDAFVHDHRRDFASLVLSGQLSFTNYSRSPDGDAEVFATHRFHDLGEDRRKPIERLGPARLVATASYTLRERDVHALAYDVAHRGVPRVGAVTASMVLSGPPVRAYSLTYRAREVEGDRSHPHELYSCESVTQTIQRLRERLS